MGQTTLYLVASAPWGAPPALTPETMVASVVLMDASCRLSSVRHGWVCFNSLSRKPRPNRRPLVGGLGD